VKEGITELDARGSNDVELGVARDVAQGDNRVLGFDGLPSLVDDEGAERMVPCRPGRRGCAARTAPFLSG